MGTNTKHKILVVDDDQEILRGLSIRLRASGYETSFAMDGMSAISVARKEMPDLVILDIGLPAGDGFTVLDRLQNLAPLAGVPVIVLSARDPQAAGGKALAGGAVAFFQKPADNEELMAAVEAALMPFE